MPGKVNYLNLCVFSQKSFNKFSFKIHFRSYIYQIWSGWNKTYLDKLYIIIVCALRWGVIISAGWELIARLIDDLMRVVIVQHGEQDTAIPIVRDATSVVTVACHVADGVIGYIVILIDKHLKCRTIKGSPDRFQPRPTKRKTMLVGPFIYDIILSKFANRCNVRHLAIRQLAVTLFTPQNTSPWFHIERFLPILDLNHTIKEFYIKIYCFCPKFL